MVLVYHGTSVRHAIKISNKGAVLSPLEMRIELFRHANIKRLESAFPGKSIEEAALDSLSYEYEEREIEHRVKCLSVVEDISRAVPYATRYEMRDRKDDGPDVSGGLILAIDIGSEYLDGLVAPPSENTIFILKRLSLDGLKEIHLSPMARISGKAIRHAFAKYTPVYLDIKK